MGFGNYSHEAHRLLIRGRANVPQEQVFKQQAIHPLMNPRGSALARAATAPTIRAPSASCSRST